MPRLVIPILLLVNFIGDASAIETVRFRQEDTVRTAVGRVLVEAQDGGLMIQTVAGRVWTIYPNEIVDRTSDDAEFVPITADAMQQQLTEQLPAGFDVFRTGHYIIAYNSSEAYARRVGRLVRTIVPRVLHLLAKSTVEIG